MDLTIFIQAAIDALMIGMFYILVALGLTIMFGILRVFNFAHGEVYMLGGFFTYYLYGQYHLNYFLTVIGSVIMGGILGLVFERVIFRRFRDNPFNGFIASLGLVWILQTFAATRFGVLDKDVPTVFPGTIRIMGASISVERVSAMLLAIAMVFGLYVFIQWTKTGKALRAVSQDRDAASLQGIPVDRVIAIAFGLGSAFAAVAGAIMSPIFLINPYIGGFPLMKAFIVIILGGMGSLPGTVIGGLVLGFVESFATLQLSMGAVSAIGFAIVILILLIRPKGLLGRGE